MMRCKKKKIIQNKRKGLYGARKRGVRDMGEGTERKGQEERERDNRVNCNLTIDR